jgi:hypothetical protein
MNDANRCDCVQAGTVDSSKCPSAEADGRYRDQNRVATQILKPALLELIFIIRGFLPRDFHRHANASRSQIF